MRPVSTSPHTTTHPLPSAAIALHAPAARAFNRLDTGNPWWGVLALLAVVALWSLAFAPWSEPDPPGATSQRVTQVQVAQLPTRLDQPPSPLLDLPHPGLRWQEGELPSAWRPERDAPTGHARSHLFRVALQTVPAGLDMAVLVPRWHGIGRIAIYGDGRLLYRSVGDPVWNNSNRPLLVALGAPGTRDRPAELVVRIDRRLSGPGTLSPLWIGPERDLQPLYRHRLLLQSTLPQGLLFMTLGLGLFALALWLPDRTDAMYLLFAAFAVMWVVRSLRYHTGDGPVPFGLSAPWFGWLSANAGQALVLLWTRFVMQLVPTVPRWLWRALAAYAGFILVLTLPPLAGAPGVDALKTYAYWSTIAIGVPTGLYLAWLAWRAPGREGRLATTAGLLHVPVALHDAAMQADLLDPLAYYWWPVSTTLRVSVFAYIVLSRHLRAERAVEAANQTLSDQLTLREAELSASHQALVLARERDAQARERERLMQDLHDGMGSQLLAALHTARSSGLDADALCRLLQACLDDLKHTVDAMELREDDVQLLLANFRYRVEPRLQAAGLSLHWSAQDLPALPWLDRQSALQVLRILQEGVNNVIQHARARSLRLASRPEPDGVIITLDDDGRGFDASTAGDGGQGLRIMRRRASQLGARLQWEPMNPGTRLALWLPMRAPGG